MARFFSRRLFVGGLAAAGGAVAASPAALGAAAQPSRISVAGKVKWCNYRRAILAVKPDRSDASDRTILLQRFRDGVDADVLRKLLRPNAPVTLDLTWHPEVDLFSPWRVDAVIAGGRKLLSAPSRAQDTDDMSLVIKLVSAHFGESEAMIVSHRLPRNVVRARQIGMYLAHAVVGYSVTEISTAFGSDWIAADHATRKVQKDIKVDREVADAVAQLRARIHELGQRSAEIA